MPSAPAQAPSSCGHVNARSRCQSTHLDIESVAAVDVEVPEDGCPFVELRGRRLTGLADGALLVEEREAIVHIASQRLERHRQVVH